ncbi:thiamine pyrophosphate-dependent dehydrogenase E1 component subunit alpha [Candidatus Aenigmatarchaeota archaeon]
MVQLSRTQKLNILKKMILIRAFEKKIEYLFSRGKIYGTTHLYVGQEANAVGVCELLNKDDLITSTHRGHGHAIAKGLDIKRLMAEIIGKETGYCKGKGGTQHISSMSDGFIGTNGITGGLVPIAVGATFSSKLQSKKNIVVSFIGDGAMGEGVVLESLNMASLWKLPIIIYCENNLYAMSTHVSDGIASENLVDIAKGFGIKTFIVDGNDVFDIMDKIEKSMELIKEGKGPIYIEAKTYRFLGHSKSDMREYRTREEEELWIKRCPIERLKSNMIENNELTQDAFDVVHNDIEKQMDEAVEFSEKSKELDKARMFDDL